MKKIVALGCVWAAVLVPSVAAEEVFSKAVPTADFSAAGLGKLSREELTRLDKLVRDYQSGALVAARRDVDLAEAKVAQAEAQTRAARAEVQARAAKAEVSKPAQVRVDVAPEKKSEGGLLAKAKVLLTPGTEIEYAAVESRIAGDFAGWDGRAVLTLENGQRWQIANGGSYSTPPLASPKVKIVPASLGGFWMTIEGVTNRVRVAPFGAK